MRASRLLVLVGLTLTSLVGCVDPSTAPGEGPALASLEAGGNGTCALTQAGSIYCWGAALQGVGGLPELVSGELSISDMTIANGFGGAVCATATGGALYCWGNVADQWDVYRGYPGFLQDSTPLHGLAAGDGHACGIDAGGAAYCWGSSLAGKRGEGASVDQAPLLTMNKVVGDLEFVALAAERVHTCGLTTTANVYCWGVGNRLGDTLGVSSTEECFFWTTCAWAPIPVRSVGSVLGLAVGGRESCALLHTGGVWCWTAMPSEDEWTVGFPHPVFIPEQVTQLAVGGWFSCALAASGKVYCWGEPGPWRGSASSSAVSQVMTPVRFTTISAGEGHACGISWEGEAYCWGYNQQGQLGNGSVTDSYVPLKVGLPEGPAPTGR